MTNREELKKVKAREQWEKLIAQGWRRTKEDQTKKELKFLIFNKWSNITQLLTNSGAISKSFILFKLFLPKSKRINLIILQAN